MEGLLDPGRLVAEMRKALPLSVPLEALGRQRVCVVWGSIWVIWAGEVIRPFVSSCPILLATSIFNSRFLDKVHRPTNQRSWPKILFYVVHTSLDKVLRAQHTTILRVRSVSEAWVLHSPSDSLQLLPSQLF